MSNISRVIGAFLLATLVASCTMPEQPAPFPTHPAVPSVTAEPRQPTLPEIQIARHPAPADMSIYASELTSIPKFDPNSTDPFQVNLLAQDLTKLDLSKSKEDLLFADFDSTTKWPTADRMPDGFDWKQIMEIGKDPGLGIRALHKQGITGNGVGIAIVDQTLLVDHVEYRDRIRIYEETDDITAGWLNAQPHGSAVASIAVGKTVGVAPGADLYFIATATCSQGTYETNDFGCLATSIRRILEINKSLPEERKIRVLSMSVGWGPESKGYEEIMAAVKEAESAGIFALNTSLSHTHRLYFHGLGRSPLADPNDFRSYKPGLWWEKDFYKNKFSTRTLLVPMDSRTTASPAGAEDYVFYREGGWSWSIPYIAGMYALAVQVKPEITPQEFWNTALSTGRTIHVGRNGQDYELGVILDPQALIKALQNK